jgi:phosphotransferase system enzyme I (PtsI)
VRKIKGRKISPGIVSGPIFYFERSYLPVPKHFVQEADFDSEWERFKQAVQKSIAELTQVRDLVLNHLDENHARIIEAQLIAVQDQEMFKSVRELMQREKKNITWSYYEVMESYEKLLLNSYSQYFKERTTDLRDVKKRVIYHLTNQTDYNLPGIQQPSIIVSEKISPGDLIHIDHELALGIITRFGGVDSHVGILARAFRVPYISNIAQIDELVSYSEIILDADNEEILLNITEEIKKKYRVRIRKYADHRNKIITKKVANTTKDGIPFHIYINAGFVDEVNALNPNLIQGIGLFRTEYLCIERNTIPSEEEQVKAYKTVLDKMKRLPVVFRVYDFGRDKILAMLDLDLLREDHLFDEWGGIGFLLDNPEILQTQLRALLKASTSGDIQIMLPLVMSVLEVVKTKELLHRIQADLEQEGVSFRRNIQLGAMIETRRILDELEELAQEVDFFSIGTNDLALYLIGTSRDSSVPKNYYHPKLFQALDKIVRTATDANIPVNVCGEMASDRFALVGLAALGIHSISVSANALEIISNVVRKLDIQLTQELSDKILRAHDAATIYALLKEFYREKIE